MAAWQLKILGGFALHSPDGEVVTIASRKDRLVLAYLAVNSSRPQSRERLSSLLWPDRAELQARGSLRQSLATLRELLGSEALITSRETAAINPSLLESDANRFAALAQAGDSRACDLYEGELLAGLESGSDVFEQWLRTERQRLGDLAAQLVIQLAAAPAVPNLGNAVALARRLLDHDRLREPLHRALMRLLIKGNDRAAALKAYAACRDALQSELGVEPELETEQLYRDILTGTTGRADHSVPEGGQSGERPSLAVLPFSNLSGDQTLAPLCEGLAEEITTGLGRFRSLLVIDRNSSSAVASQTADTAEIGKRLGVSLLVQGSVQRFADRLRITVRLVDATSRIQSWSESFDCVAEDALSLPDTITRSIIATLHGRVESYLTEQSLRKPVLAAYSAVLLGIKHIRGFRPEDNRRAVEYFQRAVEIDPGFALARAYRAFADVVLNNYEYAPKEVLARARVLIEEAVDLEPQDPRCNWLLSIVCGCAGDAAGRVRYLRRAQELNPNDANFIAQSGFYAATEGRTDEGLEQFRRALQLNPYPPEWYWLDLGDVLYMSSRYEEAIESYRHLTKP